MQAAQKVVQSRKEENSLEGWSFKTENAVVVHGSPELAAGNYYVIYLRQQWQCRRRWRL